MTVWSWTKRVITDTGGGFEPVPVGLERNPDAVVELGAENPPDVPLYVLRVGLESGFGRTQAGLPVYRRDNPSPHPILKEIYHCEVAGKVLEAANVYALREKVQRQLEVIAPAHSLPLCYFRAPRFDYSLPVHEEGARLVCPVLAGPKIKADGLAELRGPVVRHLRTAGYLATGEEPEVLVVRPSDLRLVPPAAIIRSLDDPELWLPTVEGSSAEGPVIGLLTHPAELLADRRRRREAPAQEAPPSASDVTALIRYIGGEMAIRGRLLDPWALYACEVRPEIWAWTEELTDPTSNALTCTLEGGEGLDIPVRHTAAGELVAALQERGITVFLAGDLDALAASVGRYLTGAGFLRHPGDLRTEVVGERPPESLDPDSIWTGEPRRGPAEPSEAGTEAGEPGERSAELQPTTQAEIEDLEVTQK
jgi:hypothetical protein